MHAPTLLYYVLMMWSTLAYQIYYNDGNGLGMCLVHVYSGTNWYTCIHMHVGAVCVFVAIMDDC